MKTILPFSLLFFFMLACTDKQQTQKPLDIKPVINEPWNWNTNINSSGFMDFYARGVDGC